MTRDEYRDRLEKREVTSDGQLIEDLAADLYEEERTATQARIDELEAALRKARKAVEGYFAYWGADHDDDDCPEDDTCECPHIRAINDALKETSDTERPAKGGGA